MTVFKIKVSFFRRKYDSLIHEKLKSRYPSYSKILKLIIEYQTFSDKLVGMMRQQESNR
jgi:hypothetical protein